MMYRKPLWPTAGETGTYYGIARTAPNGLMLTMDRPLLLMQCLRECAGIPGDIVEFGVYKGNSAYCMAHLLKKMGVKKTIHLFDSFKGLPAGDSNHGDTLECGRFADTSLDEVKAAMPADVDIRYHVGWIPETLKDTGIGDIAFAHVDVDLYWPTIQCCDFVGPRAQHGAVLVCDDYGCNTTKGARAAMRERFGEAVSEYSTGQGVVQFLRNE